MKADELMLGNYIQYRKDGCMTYDTVKSIYYDDELQLYRIELNSRSFNLFHITINGVSPIPLTDEILLKCGFIKTDCFYYTYRCPFTLWYDNFNDGSYNALSETNNIARNIKHLHQLQNLFFALTGNELNTCL